MLNLTPYAVVVRTAEGVDHVFNSTGVARVSSTAVVLGIEPITGAEIIRSEFGPVEGMPSVEEAKEAGGVIVSGLVLARLSQEWTGVAFAPATGPNDGVIRNEAGHVVAVTKLVTV